MNKMNIFVQFLLGWMKSWNKSGLGQSLLGLKSRII